METRVNPLQLLKRKAIVRQKAPIYFKIKQTHIQNYHAHFKYHTRVKNT